MPVRAKTWLTLGVISLLSVTTAIGAVSRSWHAAQRRSAQARYFWERGRCYGVQIEKGGSLTKVQVDSPEGLCPSIDWSHRQPGMEWRAVVDCHYDSCARDSILAKAQRDVTSYVAAGPSREQGCLTAERYLRDAIRSMRCRATACTCQKADFDAAHP
jgi:hypothetical protein